MTAMKCDKNYRLKYTEKAKRLVKSLTLEEKVYLMSGKVDLQEMMEGFLSGEVHYNDVPYPTGGIIEKGIPPVLFCDGPRGVVCGIGKSTCFPVSMLRGASFDVELEEEIGEVIGKEIRAWKGNLFGGVCINLPYNPGWGRSQETFGEDSFHIGQMGSALVRGVQSKNVIATIKHFAFNSMEISRFKVNVTTDKRTEREVYFSHFKDCIDAGAACVMSAYNLYQGEHCGQNEYLLTDVLKNEWDFDGFVMSDFVWGVRDTVKAGNSGQDLEMCNTNFFGENLVKAVRDGLVPEEKIDEAAVRLIRTVLAFTEADEDEYPESLLGCEEHVALAMKAAEKGITLIKNKDAVLPLNRNDKPTVLVLGKLANQGNIGDYGSSRVYPEYVVSPVEGLIKANDAGKVIYNDGSDPEEAKKLAKEVDYVVFVVGFDHDDEGEYVAEQTGDAYTEAIGGDRLSLGLHRDEVELIKQVGPVNPNSIVVLIGGNMIMIDEWKDDVSAILMAYYPGMEGGTAIAKILFGDVNPGGKLPYVVPASEVDLPQVEWDTEKQFYGYYHGYAKLEKEGKQPSVPFGFGLSYTTFDLGNAVFAKEENAVVASCDVTNSGAMAGDEVVQVYIGFENSAIDRPVKSLKGFERVSLEPNETQRVNVVVPFDKLRWYDESDNTWKFEHMVYQVYIGTSSDNADLIAGQLIL